MFGLTSLENSADDNDITQEMYPYSKPHTIKRHRWEDKLKVHLS